MNTVTQRIDDVARERHRKRVQRADTAEIDRLTAKLEELYDAQRVAQAGRIPKYWGTTTRWAR